MADSSDDEAPCGYNHVDVDVENPMEHSSLFWNELPEDHEQHPDMAAIQALQDEQTPEETAEACKINGNSQLKMGLKAKNKSVLRDAITHYTKGIQVKCSDAKLNSILYSNKAHVEGLLGNYRTMYADAIEAKNLDPSNVKAYFRGAKAALELKRWDQCTQLCEEGKAVDPKASEFSTIAQEASKSKAEADELEQRLIRSREAESAPAKALAQAILQRGLKVTAPQVRMPEHGRPYLGEAGELHWPMLLMYPGGNMQQDVIQDFCETDAFSDHLDVMFAPDAPPLEWDQKREYSRERVELYYLTYAGKPLKQEQVVDAMKGTWPEGFHDSGPKRYGEKASKWRRVEEELTLIEVMKREDYICPGLPVFFVVAAGTDYRKRFLEAGNK